MEKDSNIENWIFYCYQVIENFTHNKKALIDAIKAYFCVAPLLGRISNQFYDDLRKIAELRPLVKDIDLSKIEIEEKPEQRIPGRFLAYKDIGSLMRVDFGREFILP